MARRPDDPFARQAAYALLGAMIGGATVWFVADSFSLATLGSGLAGGAIAGLLAGFIRSRLGMDRD